MKYIDKYIEVKSPGFHLPDRLPLLYMFESNISRSSILYIYWYLYWNILTNILRSKAQGLTSLIGCLFYVHMFESNISRSSISYIYWYSYWNILTNILRSKAQGFTSLIGCLFYIYLNKMYWDQVYGIYIDIYIEIYWQSIEIKSFGKYLSY